MIESTKEVREMTFRAAIFDLDGTLLDSMGVWEQVDVDFLKKRGLPVPEGYGDAMRARGLEEAAVYTKRFFDLPDSVESIAGEWLSMVRSEYAHRVGLMPGAAEILSRYKSRGVKLAVATCSAKELVEPCLERLGILEYFDSICTAESVSRGKEFPDIFFLAASKLGVPPGECAVFDDVLPAVRSAKAAGMSAIAVFEPHSRHLSGEIRKIADRYIMNLNEALEWV